MNFAITFWAIEFDWSAMMKLLQLITASGTDAAEIGKDYRESCDGVRWEEPYQMVD